jgi:hypothetical protein
MQKMIMNVFVNKDRDPRLWAWLLAGSRAKDVADKALEQLNKVGSPTRSSLDLFQCWPNPYFIMFSNNKVLDVLENKLITWVALSADPDAFAGLQSALKGRWSVAPRWKSPIPTSRLSLTCCRFLPLRVCLSILQR